MQYKSKCCQADFTEFKSDYNEDQLFEDYCSHYSGYVATCNQCNNKCEIVRYDLEL